MHFTDLRKINALLFFLIASTMILYFAAVPLRPLAFAVFLAFLLTPVSAWMEHKGLGRTLASGLSTLIVLFTISGILTLMATQLRGFAAELPEVEGRIEQLIDDLRGQLPMQRMLAGGGTAEENDLARGSEELLHTVRGAVTGFLGETLTITIQFALMLVYLFLLLANRHHYERFIFMYTKEDDREKTRDVLDKSAGVAHRYLWGRVRVMTLLGIAYIITFLAFDVPYAILLTVFGALVTIIPYVGPFISGAAPILIMLVSGRDMGTVWLFAGVVMVIQLIESYVLEPWLLSGAVHISPLTVIIAIILGGAVWGVAGMILFVPLFAIAKIFFDHVEGLRPVGYLFGLEKKGRVKMSAGRAR
jgi:predicted PurR-regulated permease PerM